MQTMVGGLVLYLVFLMFCGFDDSLEFHPANMGGNSETVPNLTSTFFQAWVETLDICGYLLHYAFGT